MIRKLARPFLIRTRIEASFIIYALALGAVERGKGLLADYPGHIGVALFGAGLLAVLMAGAKIMDAVATQRD